MDGDVVLIATSQGGQQWTVPLELSACRVRQLQEDRASLSKGGDGFGGTLDDRPSVDLGNADSGQELRPAAELLGVRMRDLQSAQEARKEQDVPELNDGDEGDRASQVGSIVSKGMDSMSSFVRRGRSLAGARSVAAFGSSRKLEIKLNGDGLSSSASVAQSPSESLRAASSMRDVRAPFTQAKRLRTAATHAAMSLTSRNGGGLPKTRAEKRAEMT